MQARLPIRGHGDETESNFTQLLKLRGEDDPRVEAWLKKKRLTSIRHLIYRMKL